MNLDTQEALVAINRRFYADHADSFDRTRSTPWKGWHRLLDVVEETWSRPDAEALPLRVLDVGCGNGRFGSLVEERWVGPWSYLGLDSSEELLAAAAARLAQVDPLELRRWDLLEDSLATEARQAFDLVAIFGVLHHVPGADLRMELLLRAADLLAPGGYLAFTVWRFGEDPRFERRVLPWDQATSEVIVGVATEELEAGDVLLRWGDEGAVRYCHGANDEEQRVWLEALAEESSLELALRFDADGKTGQLNRYVLLRKPVLLREPVD